MYTLRISASSRPSKDVPLHVAGPASVSRRSNAFAAFDAGRVFLKGTGCYSESVDLKVAFTDGVLISVRGAYGRRTI